MRGVRVIAVLLGPLIAACASAPPSHREWQRARRAVESAFAESPEALPDGAADAGLPAETEAAVAGAGRNAGVLGIEEPPGLPPAPAFERTLFHLRPAQATEDPGISGQMVPAFRQSLRRLEMEAGARPYFDRELTRQRQSVPKVIVCAEIVRVLGEALGGAVGDVCRDLAILARGGKDALAALEREMGSSRSSGGTIRPFVRLRSGDLEVGFRRKDFLAGGDLVVGFGRRRDLEIDDERMFYVEIEFTR